MLRRNSHMENTIYTITQTQVIFTIFLTVITAKKGQGMGIEREIKGA